MDFLNKAFAQVADLFRSMTPGARITTGLLLVVAVTSIGYLFAYRDSGGDCDLMNGEQFPASQVTAIETAFANEGLKSYAWQGRRIRVPHGQQNAYVAAMAKHNALPESWRDIVDNALKNTNVWSDRQQREQVFRALKQRQLEQFVCGVKGIQTAKVLYDTESKRGFNQENVTTASVGVTTTDGQPLSESQVHSIRMIVSGAVAGLQPENVRVADLTAGRTFAGDSDGSSAAMDDPYGSRKQWYEQQWKKKILDALSYVPGVTVAPNVVLNTERNTHKEKVQHDPKGTALQVTEKSETSSSDSAGAGGRVGYPAQQPNTALQLPTAASKGTHEEKEQTETNTLNAVSSSREVVDAVGLTPKRVSVAIGIPDSYLEKVCQKVWRERNPAAPGAQPKTPDQAVLDTIRTEEIGKITKHVASLLPPVEGMTDSTQLVQVTAFSPLPEPEVVLPGAAENALGWLAEHWTTLGTIALALFALLMLRSMVRSGPAAMVTRGGPKVIESRVEAAEETPPEATAKQARLRRFSAGGPNLRDELSELVQEDPDAAANVLRTWIGSTAQK